MNRPESRNALSREMVQAMHSALTRLATDPSIRLIVLTGSGRAFCSGGDVKAFAKAAAGGAPATFACARRWPVCCTKCRSPRWR